MQDREVKLLPEVFRDLALESVEHRVAERAGRHHGLCAACLSRQDVLAGELDRDLFVMRGGVKPATFSSPAIIDGPAAQDFRKPLQRNIVARVERTHIAKAGG